MRYSVPVASPNRSARFKNQPVRAASLETFFPGDLNVLARLGEVQRRFRGQFPNLFVPRVVVDEALPLRPYQLRPTDGRKSLAVALNQATFVSFEYPGHAVFIDEATSTLDETLRLLEIDVLNRVVYRYDNEVGLARGEERSLAIGKVLSLQLPTIASDPTLFRELRAEWTQATARGEIRVSIEVEARGNVDVLKFSIAATVARRVEVSSLRACASEAHDDALEGFKRLVTASFFESLEEDDDGAA